MQRRDGRNHHHARRPVRSFTLRRFALAPSRPPGPWLPREVPAEAVSGIIQGDPVLGPFRPGQARRYRADIQAQGGGIVRLGHACLAPHPLRLCVSLHQFDLFIVPARQAQVVDGFPVNGEYAAGRAVFRGHVGDGRPVGQGQVIQAVTVEFDKLAHHPVCPEHFNHGQDQVRGRGAFRQGAVEFETDHFGDQHGDGLPQHRRTAWLQRAARPAEHAPGR